MNYQDSMFKQVRRATGSGTRELIVKKHETVSSILERVKTCFFPGGTSMKDCMLFVTVSGEPLDGSVTVGSLYEQTNHKVGRVYLCTKKLECNNPEPCDVLPNIRPASQTLC